jgi:hypothetical protein
MPATTFRQFRYNQCNHIHSHKHNQRVLFRKQSFWKHYNNIHNIDNTHNTHNTHYNIESNTNHNNDTHTHNSNNPTHNNKKKKKKKNPPSTHTHITLKSPETYEPINTNNNDIPVITLSSRKKCNLRYLYKKAKSLPTTSLYKLPGLIQSCLQIDVTGETLHCDGGGKVWRQSVEVVIPMKRKPTSC